MANNGELVKGSGSGTRHWNEDFVLTDGDGVALFTVARTTGLVTAAGGIVNTLPPALSLETALTAAAGGTQAAALALSATKAVHNVATVATAADSVKLPAATGSGKLHFVKNSAAANSLQLFGASTETIDGVASATGVAIAAGKARLLVDLAAGAWVSLLGA